MIDTFHEQARHCLELLNMPTDDAMIETVVAASLATGSLDFYTMADSIRLILQVYGKPVAPVKVDVEKAEAALREGAKKNDEWWRGNTWARKERS